MDALTELLNSNLLTFEEIQDGLSRGWTPQEMLAAAKRIDNKSIEHDLDPAGDIQDFLWRVKPDDKERFSRDDRGMSKLFYECFHHEIVYNVTAKEWYRYDGKIWKPDRGGMFAARCAKEFAEALVIYGFQLLDGAEKTSFLKFVGRYGDFSRRRTLVEDARAEMFIANDDLDRNGNLYNCQNGVYDLETGKLLPHSPQLLLSHISSVKYEEGAEAPLFERFLKEIMMGDSAKTVYLLKHFGLSLTEDTSAEHMLILYGATTRNGKSTLLETLSYMHGGENGYAISMQPETLAMRKNRDSRQASGDIARLNGCRMLITSEPPKRMLFDAGLLKQLLGRDTITARQLYEREFQFVPRFKLFMSCNNLPVVNDDTLFSSGRLQVVEFNRHFSASEQDTTLKNRLRESSEISGIFNWCLAGLRLYQEEGMTPPSTVVQAVSQYRESSDKIRSFLTDCAEKTGKNSGAGAAYAAYREWCLDCGFGVESKKSFFEELKFRGLFADRGMVNGQQIRNILVGYELLNDADGQQEIPF